MPSTLLPGITGYSHPRCYVYLYATTLSSIFVYLANWSRGRQTGDHNNNIASKHYDMPPNSQNQIVFTLHSHSMWFDCTKLPRNYYVTRLSEDSSQMIIFVWYKMYNGVFYTFYGRCYRIKHKLDVKLWYITYYSTKKNSERKITFLKDLLWLILFIFLFKKNR